MSVSFRKLTMLSSLLLALCVFSSHATAQVLFTDNFENRVKDQALIAMNWTWFEQDFSGTVCTGNPTGEWGPWSDGDGSDYMQENRNYWTASNDQGGGDSYFRAGLEAPAWDGALSNMVRVYGNQYSAHTDCHRVKVFQEMPIASDGDLKFSFDVAQAQFGAQPQNGEITGAFVQILKSSDSSFGTLLFQTMLTTPPVATSPGDVSTASQSMEFTIPAEWVGELLQFGFYNDVTTSAGQSPWTSSALYDNVTLESVAVVEPPPVGPGVPGDFEGIPIPQWALLLMAGLLGWLGAKKLRARKES
jgi:hypothetical protein